MEILLVLCKTTFGTQVRHDFYSILSDSIKTLITDLAKNAPMTLVHTDVWINNFCFVNDQFCALDWQTVMIGPGVIDLVKKKWTTQTSFDIVLFLFLKATLLDTTQFYSNESEIVSLYYDTLNRFSVGKNMYIWDSFVEHYKLAKRWSFINTFAILGCTYALEKNGTLLHHTETDILHRWSLKIYVSFSYFGIIWETKMIFEMSKWVEHFFYLIFSI